MNISSGERRCTNKEELIAKLNRRRFAAAHAIFAAFILAITVGAVSLIGFFL